MERALNLLSDEFGERVALVLIIDELFDFLRSKGEGSPEFIRDIAFLRELGEASRNYEFFVLASLQEDILDPDKAGGAERENLNRIRQRFETIQIPYFNLQKVARERVLRKNQQQVEELRKLYSFLRERYFPSLQFDETSFVDLYPVHPFVLRVYEKIIREVGPRSLIAFLSQSALEIQDEPYDNLITLSELYDRLQSELFPHPLFGKFVRDIFPYFQSNIPAWFDDKETASWMEKAVKALIILNIAKEKVTCKQLAELILYKGIEGEINYNMFAHHMSTLHKNSATYLYIETGSDLEAIYNIRPEGIDPESLIRKEIARIKDDDPRLWRITLENLKELGAPREMEGAGCVYKVTWRNTERKGWVRFVEEVSDTILEEVQDSLNKDDKDFYLLVLRPNLPSDFLSEKEIQEERILIWRPAELRADDLEILKRVLAIRNLLNQGLQEEVRKRIGDKTLEASDKARDLIEEIYFKRGSIKGQEPPLSGKQFSQVVEKSVNELLNSMFTFHPQFPRKISARTLNEAFSALAELITPPTPTLLDYLDQLSQAGLVVKEEEGKYIVDEGKDLYKIVIEEVKKKEYLNVAEIYKLLRAKPYGLQEDVVKFIILALVWKGLISVKGREGEFYRQDLEKLLQLKFINEDYYLHRLDIFVPHEVLKLAGIMLEREVVADTTQDKVKLWEEIRELPSKFKLDDLEGKIEGFHPPFNKALLLENLGAIKGKIESLFGVIADNPSPETGFREMYQTIKDRLDELEDAFQKLQSLRGIVNLRDRINEEIDYLQQISLPQGDSLLQGRDELMAELEGSLVSDENLLQRWIDRAETFKNSYIDRYTALHEECVGRYAPYWEEINKTKASPMLACLEGIWEIMGELGGANPASLLWRKISELLNHRCEGLHKDSLKHHPLCPNCRFNPANPPNIAWELENLKKRLEDEWEETIEEIRRKEEKIREEFKIASSMARERMEKLLQGEPVELSEEIKELLRRALGKVVIYELDIRSILRDGGIYKPDDLLERIKKAVTEIQRRGGDIRIRLRWQ